MKLSSVPVSSIAVLAALLIASPSSHADWVISPSAEAVRPAPESFAVIPQNPPGITWSRHPTATSSTWYLVVITLPSGAKHKAAVGRNWYLPTKAFGEMGTYRWTVAPFIRTSAMDGAEAAARGRAYAAGAGIAEIDAAGNAAVVALAESSASDWSTVRTFVVNASSKTYEVPSDGTLRKSVLGNPRSRLLPQSFMTYAKWTPAMIAERGDAVRRLIETVESRLTMAPVRDADWTLPPTPVTVALDAQNADIRSRIMRTAHQLQASALLFRLKSDTATGTRYLAEAIKRGDELAALSPTGPTGYARQDQATRMIALSLTKALDLLYGQLDISQRAKWSSVVKVRANDMYAELSGANGRLDQYPFDSHGGNALGYLALVAALSLGEFEEADVWFNYAVRSYIHQIYAWSGPEGGFANGTAYGQAVMDISVQIWDSLSEITGVNLYAKPWSEGFMRFMGSFVPPGQATHVFGDGHEDAPNTYLLKAFSSRIPTPVGKWYYNAVSGVEDPLTLLLAPSPLPANTVATPMAPPQASVFPSVGWVAMHSDIVDRNRTSLYFKSSPFGSYNHSHGDQNSIVLFSGGKQLLSEAGYYDWYGSPLWKNWYRQTRSHNGITYDGGIGQATDGNTVNLTRNGKIIAFTTTSALDYAEGDATPAYEGALSTARRKVWYLRNQNAAVVMDTLASATARAFEWNFHAPAAISITNGTAKIVNGDKSVCLRSLNSGTTLARWTGYTPKAGVVEDHAAFKLPKQTAAEFLVLIDIGCVNPPVRLSTSSTSRSLTVGSQTIVLPK